MATDIIQAMVLIKVIREAKTTWATIRHQAKTMPACLEKAGTTAIHQEAVVVAKEVIMEVEKAAAIAVEVGKVEAMAVAGVREVVGTDKRGLTCVSLK